MIQVDEKFRSRKFALAAAFTLTGCVGLFTGDLDGKDFYLLALAVLGAYGWSNVKEKQ